MSGASGNTIVVASPGLKAYAFMMTVLLAAGCSHILFPGFRQQWQQVRLGHSLVYAYNGDSGEYARLVATFPQGFKTGYVRILRPLYPALGFVVYQPLRLLKSRIPESLSEKARSVLAQGSRSEMWEGLDPRDLIAAWAALIVVNFMIYLAAFGLVVRFLSSMFPLNVAMVLAAYPAAHHSTIDFLLIPGADPLNVLLPAIFLYALAHWPKKQAGYLAALAMGTGMLGKGLLAPFGNWLYEHMVVRGWRQGMRAAVLCCVLFVTPMLLYLALLKLLEMPVYNHEATGDRQFLWLGDYVLEGKARAIPMQIWKNLIRHASLVVEGMAIPLALCAVLAFRRDRGTVVLDSDVKRHLVVYVVCATAFFVIGRIIFGRLSIVYYPAVVVLLGVLAVRKSTRPVTWLLLGIVASLLLSSAPSLLAQ